MNKLFYGKACDKTCESCNEKSNANKCYTCYESANRYLKDGKCLCKAGTLEAGRKCLEGKEIMQKGGNLAKYPIWSTSSGVTRAKVSGGW